MTRGAVPPPLVLAVVGAGPRPAGVLERMIANAGLAADDVLARGLQVHLVDPHPTGTGRGRIDVRDGEFRARTAVPGEEVRARVLVEARLPGRLGVRGPDPLLPGLHAAGGAAEKVLGGQTPTGRVQTTPEGHVVLPDGSVHPRRFAIGAFTSERAVAAFARPMTDAVNFRQSDALARTLLRAL